MTRSVNQSTATITVRWQFEGFHRWPDAPVQRAYLRDRHRHVFHCEATVDVLHDEREIEFHDMRDICVAYCTKMAPVWEVASCETIARDLAMHLVRTFDRVPVTVAVFEDGENGSTVTLR